MTTSPNRPRPGTGLGIVAAVAMVGCCALPALIAAGALASLGGLLGNPFVVLAGLALAGAAVAYALGRRRVGSACPPPIEDPDVWKAER